MAATRIQIDNPYTGELVAERPLVSRIEAIAALERAARAQREWARRPLSERVLLCERFCLVIENQRDRLAREITAQMGKPLSQAKSEVNTLLARARQLAGIASASLADEALPPLPGLTRFVRHQPVGVVLVIAGWSYPLLTVVNAALPALLAGNAVVLKHASRCALTAESLARAFAEADAPADLVQALDADHAVCAELIARRELGCLAFTGSLPGGRAVEREAAKRSLRVGLELGGKDAVYVAADANLEHAIVNIVDGAMYNAGQSSCGVERIYVHETLYAKFVEGALTETQKLLLGDPLLAQTSMGPMATPEAPPRLLAAIEEARVKGGRVLCGGRPASDQGRGRFFEPTLVAEATHAMRGLMVDPAFGPVVGIAKVRDDEEAVERINDSPYGLTAAVWTQDQARAFHLGSLLEAGSVFMNRCDYQDPLLPWSGIKDSGRGESLSRAGFLAVTQRKSFNFRTQT